MKFTRNVADFKIINGFAVKINLRLKRVEMKITNPEKNKARLLKEQLHKRDTEKE